MVDTWEIFVPIALLIGVGIAIFFYVVPYNYGKHVQKATITRGIAARQGTNLVLSCPVGKSIRLGKVNYLCGEIDQTTYQPVCDPMLENGNLNPATTLDAADLFKDCKGNTCTVSVPAPALPGCTSCQDVHLMGTYDCVPN